MHFVLVVACSALDGAIITPDKPTPVSGGDGTETPSIDASLGSPAGTSASPGEPKPPAMGIPIPEAQAAESGTRLKARWYVAEDGTRHWAFNWFDSERNEDCSFQPAADGVLRCLPTYPSVGALYSDPACTQVVVSDINCALQTGAPLALSSAVYDTQACGGSIARYDVRYFGAGSLVQPSELWQIGGQGCAASIVIPDARYYRLGAEIPLTRFAAAEITTD